MAYSSETPFDNIESCHQYIELLADAIEEARKEVDEEIVSSVEEGAERRRETLQIVVYNLAKLLPHTRTSARILNDLRTMRRLLLAERESSQKGER